MKRIIAFLLVFVFLIPSLASCSNDKLKNGEFSIKFGDVEILADRINSAPKNGKVTVYTRDYVIDKELSLVIGKERTNFIAFSIVRVEKDGIVEYKVAKKYKDTISDAVIPVNGFVVAMPKTMVDFDSIDVDSTVEVSGFENFVTGFELLDLASFSPMYMTSTSSRRINFLNPEGDFVDGKIYCFDKSFPGNKKIDIDNRVVSVKIKNNGYQIVSSDKLSEINKPADDELMLVFTGLYNIAYADYYFGETERISISMLDKANGYSDMAAIKVGNEVIEFDENVINVETINESGTYVFNHSFNNTVTPKSDNTRFDVVVAENMIVKVCEEGKRSLIPQGNGFVLSFVGDEASSKASLFKVGDKIESCLIEHVDLPDQYVAIGNNYFEINGVDISRNVEGLCVLYTEEYGKTTKTNIYGSEIVIKDGKVTAVNINAGSAVIPEGGYVLSMHKDNPMFMSVSNIKKGDAVSICLDGPSYNITNLKIDSINGQRDTDALVLYKDKESTGTNQYGYEIAVDKDGIAIADGFSGNMEIPDGGFVLSGHGVNKNALQLAYSIGEKIVLDLKTSSASIIKTPDLKIKNAQYNLEIVNDRLEEAKNAFYNINYKSINSDISHVETILAEAQKAFNEYEFDKAFDLSESVVLTCKNIRYSMIESKTVQNRAVWYRSGDKSDADVKRTIDKLKSLNINTIYLETWYEGYCIGNKVDIEGIDLKRNPDFDVLESFIRIGHENGIEVHAWVQNFFVGYFYIDGPAYNNPVFAEEQYKDKYIIDRNGNEHFYYTANGNYWLFLNPNDRECRDLILNIYKELITKYDLDGLHLDYVRFPEPNLLDNNAYDFGYNEDIIKGFAQKTGITGDPRKFAVNSDNYKKWVQYRCDIVTSFVGEVYDMVRSIDSDLWLSAALYPDVDTDKARILQDIRTLSEKDYFDEIFSMSYNIDNKYVKENVELYVDLINGRSFYSSGLAAFLETTNESFAYQLTDAYHSGADGISIFSLSSIRPGRYQEEIVNGAFRDPSVQVNRLSETAVGQMKYISEKIDNISFYYEFSENDKAILSGIISDITEFSKTLDFENATRAQKLNWANQALVKIDAAIDAVVNDCDISDAASSIAKDLEELKYWIGISANRLSK